MPEDGRRCCHNRIICEFVDPNRPWFGKAGTCACCRQLYGLKDGEPTDYCPFCRMAPKDEPSAA